MRTVERTIQSPNRIGLDLIAIEAGADIDLDLRLEAESEGVLVTGKRASHPHKGGMLAVP